MRLVNFGHKLDEIDCAKTHQQLDGRLDVFVTSAEELLFFNTSFLHHTVQYLGLVAYVARAV